MTQTIAVTSDDFIEGVFWCDELNVVAATLRLTMECSRTRPHAHICMHGGHRGKVSVRALAHIVRARAHKKNIRKDNVHSEDSYQIAVLPMGKFAPMSLKTEV